MVIIMTIVVLRTIFFYLFIFVIYRIMGKREVGQLSITDLIVSLLIAELTVISIENYKASILYSLIPIVILVSMPKNAAISATRRLITPTLSPMHSRPNASSCHT